MYNSVCTATYHSSTNTLSYKKNFLCKTLPIPIRGNIQKKNYSFIQSSSPLPLMSNEKIPLLGKPQIVWTDNSLGISMRKSNAYVFAKIL